LRLLPADKIVEYLNITSMKIMIQLEVSYSFAPVHTFGLSIELSKII